MKRLVQAFESLKTGVSGSIPEVRNFGDATVRSTREMAGFNSEIDQIKNRIKYFFGLTNAINLVRRTLRSTFNTIKELDATMTEAAVVTDFSVGDMWS